MNVKRNNSTTSIHIIHDKIYEKHKFKFINKLRNHKPIWYCVHGIVVCTSAYANVHFKTTTIKNMKIILIAGVPSSQALPGFLMTAPSCVCVPAVLGALAVWIQNQKKNEDRRKS